MELQKNQSEKQEVLTKKKQKSCKHIYKDGFRIQQEIWSQNATHQFLEVQYSPPILLIQSK